jgi:virginiamycin B lyase
MKNRSGRDRVRPAYLLLVGGAVAVAIAAFALSAGAAEKESGQIAGLREPSRGPIGIADARALPAATGDEEISALAAAPENVELPKVTPPAPLVGNSESASDGSWENDPESFEYQWLRCDEAGASCVAIVNATDPTYLPVKEDLDQTLRVAVTAQNSIGDATATSDATEIVRQITEYSPGDGSKPSELIAAEDGNLWFVNYRAAKLGKVSLEGTPPKYAITEYPVEDGEWLSDLAAGPGDDVWYSNGYPMSAGKVTPSGASTNYPLEGGGNPYSIGVDSTDQIWVTLSASRIAKLDSDGDVSDLFPVPTDSTPQYITLGPDDEMWFANNECGFSHPGRCAIGKITEQGEVTEYDVPKVPHDLTLGPDGNMWFTLQYYAQSSVGRITPSGTLTEFNLPPHSEPEEIIAGPDGNLWFALWGTDKLGRITPGGDTEEFPLPAGSEPFGVAVGPDDYIWYTAKGSGKLGSIGKIVVP